MNYSFIELRKGQSEGPKCKIVPPRGASHDPGMDITIVCVVAGIISVCLIIAILLLREGEHIAAELAVPELAVPEPTAAPVHGRQKIGGYASFQKFLKVRVMQQGCNNAQPAPQVHTEHSCVQDVRNGN